MSDKSNSAAGVLAAGLAVTVWASATIFGAIVFLATATWVFSADLESSLVDVLNFAAAAFLVVNGIDIQFSTLILDLRFSGFILLVFYILFRTFRWAIKSLLLNNQNNPSQKSLGILLIASISYTGLIFSVFYQQTKSLDNLLAILIWPFALSAGAGILAIMSVGGTWTLVKSGLDETSKSLIDTSRKALFVIFFISLAMFAWLGYLSWSEILGVFYDLAANGFAVAIIILLGLGWLPNYLMWIWAVLSDVTLNLGSTSVSLPATNITQLPAWPWFALVPAESPAWAEYLIALPILVGVLIAIFSHNQKYPNWIVSIVFSSLIVSIVLMTLTWFTNGSLGLEQLDNFGLDPTVLFKNSFRFFMIGATIVVALKILYQRATAPSQDEEQIASKDE